MKMKLRIVQVKVLDDISVELIGIPIVQKKAKFNIDGILGGDLMEMQREFAHASPKAYTFVVDQEFYDKNNLNIHKVIDFEVNAE